MERPCEICGDVARLGALITCYQCKISRAHNYCMKEYQKKVVGKWICEGCASSNQARKLVSKPSEDAGQSISVNPVAEKNDSGMPASSRRMKRKSRKCKVAKEIFPDGGKTVSLGLNEVRALESRGKKSFSKTHHGIRISLPSTSLVQAPTRREAPKKEASRAITPQKKLIPELLSHRDRACRPGTSHVKNEGCTPASRTFWIGNISLRFEYGNCKVHHHLKAHPPSQVLRIIYEFPKKMPEWLCFQAVPSQQCWDQLFKDSTPDERDIALFFFPGESSWDGWYASLVEFISSKMYALRKQVDDIELFVFTSKLLDTKCQRWKGRYYLWGVFNPLKQDTGGRCRSSR